MNIFLRYFKSAFLPWLVLLCGFAAVILCVRVEERLIQQKHTLHFIDVCEDFRDAVVMRLKRYDMLLQACQGLFNASEFVDREEFRKFLETVKIAEECPGILAVGFCRHVAASDRDAYVELQRAENSADFSIWPAGDRHAYCPVQYIEPFSGVNTRVVGFDVYSETVRKIALGNARDQGTTVMSDLIMLRQFDEEECPGVLLTAPVYKKGFTLNTAAQRREAVYGYVFISLKLADFFEPMVDEMIDAVALEIYDELGPVRGSLLYRSPHAEHGGGRSPYEVQLVSDSFSRQWTARFSASPNFGAPIDRTRQVVIAIAGSIISLLIFALLLLHVVHSRNMAREIAQRKVAAEALRRASHKWRVTFDAMLDPVALLDLDATIQQCNRAFAELVDLGFEEIIGQKCYVLVHKSDEQHSECPVIKSSTTLKREIWETQLGDKHVVIVADPVFDDDGSLVGIVHIIQDITRLRLAEHELGRRNDELLTILDAIPAFVWIGLDPECRVITGNRYVNEIIGVPEGANLSQTAAEQGGAPAIKHMRTDGTECWADELPMQRAVATGLPVFNEQFEYMFPNGRSFFVTGNAVPLFDASGRVRGSVAVFFDITRLIQVEEELRSYGVRQNALLAAIPDIVMEVDINKIYTWANRPGIEFFGDGVVGREASFYFEGEQDTYQQVKRLFEGDEHTVYIESWQRRRDGQKRLLAWWCHALMDSDGAVSGALSTARDITDLREMQDALQTKNRELQNFVYTVSHDLRSPLITIRTYLGHLVQDIAKGDAGRIEQDVEFIQNAAGKINLMLEELLQLSRIGRVAGPAVTTSIQDIAHEALALVAGQIEQRGVQVSVCDAPVNLYGDRVRLVQVLQNLIDNAVKYMGDQSDPRIEIGAEHNDGSVTICVRDNGKGIEPGSQTKLFQVFERLDSQAEGVGIGLALVKRIIEVHGGRIWVQSDGPGTGACFYFTLPVKSSEFVAGSSEQAAASRCSQEYVVRSSEKD